MAEVIIPTVCDPTTDESLDCLIDLAKTSADWTKRKAGYFLNKIDKILAAGVWKRRLGNGPKTWERFCRDALGFEAEFVEIIRRGVAILQTEDCSIAEAETAYQTRVLRTRSEAGAMGGKGNKAADDVSSFEHGNSREYLASRIKRDRPDVFADLEAGKYPSVRQAAIAAGIVKVPTTLQVLTKAWGKATPEERRAFLKATNGEVEC
jgi:hypothetical protein